MARRSREDYNTYMRNYILRRYHKRRAESFVKLGGKCAVCGCIPLKYEFDHVNPKDKSFGVSELWSISEERYNKEIMKCQVLCLRCHSLKTIRERGQTPAKGTHGTISSYRYCHCDLCKAAKAEVHRKWKAKQASVAKLVRPSAFNRDIAGSSPAGRTIHA